VTRANGMRLVGVTIKMGRDDAPDEGLARPAYLEPGEIVRTSGKVRREHLVTEHGRSKGDPELPAIPSHDVILPTPGERAAGVVIESYRRKGRTHYRAVRTLDMGDDPLPALPYRSSEVDR
jgi:hypothetical protein